MKIGRNFHQSTFFFENKPIANSNLIKDLGVFINSDLNFSYHIHDFVTRAKQRSSLIFRSFMSHNVTNLKRAFITYVRPLLEYASPVWSPSLASHIYLINEIESVQRSFTKRLPGMRTLSYSDRLNPRTPKVKIHLRTPKGGGGTTPPGFWSSRRNFSKISRMGMFSGSRNPTVITKKFYLHCMTLKIKVKHPFE